METIFILLVAAAVMALVVSVLISPSGGGPEPRLAVAGTPARLTLTEVAQVNRIAMLRLLSPELALQLAARLEGDAWQVANAPLYATLWQRGRLDEAQALRSRLDPHHSHQALVTLLKELVDAEKDDEAAALLERLGEALPEEPLLRSALLAAQGKPEDARSELEHLLRGERLSELQWLELARLQREQGDADAARHSLEQFWTLSQGSEPQALLGMDMYARELARLGDIERLLERASLLELERENPFIAPLIEAGLFEQAIKQIERLDPLWRGTPCEQLLDTLLQRGHLQQAEALIAAADESLHGRLLLSLLRWRVDHGQTENVEQDIQRLARHEALRIDLSLSLGRLYEQSHPDIAGTLLAQADRKLEALPAGEERDQLRLFMIELQLEMQTHLPERQRNSYEIRQALEEMQRISDRQPFYNQVLNLQQRAMLLKRLGRTDDALQLLDDLQLKLRNAQPDEDQDEFDLALLQEGLAIAYVRLDQFEQARSLHAQIETDISAASEWQQVLVEHDHLDHAVENLSYTNLFDPEQTLDKLLAKLHDSEDEVAIELNQKLLDKLTRDDFWPQPAAA